jgi:hypothetical protein
MDFFLTWSNTNFPLVDLPLFSFSFCCAAGLAALSPSSFGHLRQGREGEGGTGEQRRCREKERIGGEDSNDTGFKGENLNIQRPKLNYSYLIHPTSESSM